MGIQVTSTAFEDDILFLQASSQAVKLWFFPKFLAAILLTNKGQNACQKYLHTNKKTKLSNLFKSMLRNKCCCAGHRVYYDVHAILHTLFTAAPMQYILL